MVLLKNASGFFVNQAFGYQSEMVLLMMEDLALVAADQRLLLVLTGMC